MSLWGLIIRSSSYKHVMCIRFHLWDKFRGSIWHKTFIKAKHPTILTKVWVQAEVPYLFSPSTWKTALSNAFFSLPPWMTFPICLNRWRPGRTCMVSSDLLGGVMHITFFCNVCDLWAIVCLWHPPHVSSPMLCLFSLLTELREY